MTLAATLLLYIGNMFVHVLESCKLKNWISKNEDGVCLPCYQDPYHIPSHRPQTPRSICRQLNLLNNRLNFILVGTTHSMTASYFRGHLVLTMMLYTILSHIDRITAYQDIMTSVV